MMSLCVFSRKYDRRPRHASADGEKRAPGGGDVEGGPDCVGVANGNRSGRQQSPSALPEIIVPQTTPPPRRIK